MSITVKYMGLVKCFFYFVHDLGTVIFSRFVEIRKNMIDILDLRCIEEL